MNRSLKAGMLALAVAGASRERAAAQEIDAAPVVPPGASVDAPPMTGLYATPILQGSENEYISVRAMNEAGDRAILERISKGVLFFAGDTSITLLERTSSGWREAGLLSRSNGNWIGGVSLAPLAFSSDGRYLIFKRLEDLKEYHSGVINVLDIDRGRQTTLGPARGSLGDSESEKSEFARLVTESPWFRERFAGRTFADVFPDGQARCKDGAGVKTTIDGRRRLLVTMTGREPFVYPLEQLPGTRAWAFQGAYGGTMSKDCSRGLTTVQELLKSTGPSFFYGGDAYNANMRVMEFGAR